MLLAALCQGQEPESIASQVGTGGSAALKRLVIEAVNDRLRAVRARRAELAEDPGYLRRVLHEGNERAREIAEHTLQDVRTRMHTSYPDIPRRVLGAERPYAAR